MSCFLICSHKLTKDSEINSTPATKKVLSDANKREKPSKKLPESKTIATFVNAIARMAESVDASVSNTDGATHPGSIPGPGTEQRALTAGVLCFCVCHPAVGRLLSLENCA